MTLDFDREGHVCGPNGECQDGYACNASNVCVKAVAEGGCSPECGAFEECIRDRCVPTCDGRACASGMECISGLCQVLPVASGQGSDLKLGARCDTDVDCPGVGPGSQRLFCMTPFGGRTSSVCSGTCSSDADCGAFASSCKTFRTEQGSVSLCVADSFMPCTLDSECMESGLVCGTYETGTDPSRDLSNVRAVMACRAPIASGREPGADCQPDANPCKNGLCVPTGTGAYRCTASCNVDTDCTEMFKDSTGKAEPASCVDVTVGGRVVDFDYPYVRPKLCMPRMVSLGSQCGGLTCNFDAPVCIARTDAEGSVCAPHCTDARRGEGECLLGFTCEKVGAGSYCFKTTSTTR